MTTAAPAWLDDEPPPTERAPVVDAERAAYDAIEAMNWSSLKRLHTSAKLFRYRTEHPEGDKPSYLLGRAVHCAVLEPEAYPHRYVTPPPRPPGIDGRTKAGKAELAAWRADVAAAVAGGTELTPGDAATVAAVAAAIRADPAASDLLSGGRSEVTAQWVDEATGLACKARLDFVSPLAVVDLKTEGRSVAPGIAPPCFPYRAAGYLYHGQIAWYLDGAIAAGLVPPDASAWLVAVETHEPYDVACFEVAGADLEAGRNLVRQLLAKFDACHAADYWPGVAPQPVPLGLPHWAPGMGERLDDGGEW